MKKVVSFVLLLSMLFGLFSAMPMTANAAWTIDYSPYAKVESAYSASVSCGTIRYISQISGSTYFYSAYWPSSSFGGYASPGSECGTASISMALSYVGVNKTPKTILETNNGYTYFTGWGPSTSSPSVSTGMSNYINGNGKYSPVIIHLPGYSSAGHWVVLIGKVSSNVYYVLDPANATCWNITVNGTSATYTKNGYTIYDTIDRTYQYYNADAVIEDVEKYRPGKPCLTGMQSTYEEGTSVVFRWNATSNTTHYNLYIHKMNSLGNYETYEDIFYATSGITRLLPEGNYKAFVQSTNSCYWESDGSTWLYKNSDLVYFSVVHQHSYKSVVTAPTCIAQGYTTYTCTICASSYRDNYTSALGHNYSYRVTTTPTTSASGTLTGTCSRCSGTTTVTLPKLNTTDYTYSVVKAATCTATGTGRYTWKTTTYGSFYFDVTIAKTSHNYTATVTAPTCTAQGYTTHKCSGCGDTYIDGYVAALGHEESDWIVDYDATCTASGSKHTQCTRCGVTMQTSIISAIGHNESVWIIDKNASCTASGSKHTECLTCGATLQTTSIPATGHMYQEVVTAPTCTERGCTTHTCANCGDSFVDSYTEALGHAWDNGTVTMPPTATETGIKTYTCTRCAVTTTELIPATGEKEPCDGGTDCPSAKFVDVKASDWFHEYVDFAVSNGLFGGMSANTFEPNTAMTRAMLVTVLWRYAGQPNEGTNGFTDVQNGQWYTDAVAWAAHNGIVGGVGNNKFDPNGNITREQMATILYRYANGNGIDTSARAELNSFPDGNKVSSYANDAICWAVAEGLINGSDGKLMPQGNATRAQVAAILMRFIENVVNK